ncbi:hypothetical protein DPEC_G00211170 [Dallia pectoralis]|uniref:Uncharacterized protein n=1 Tax=Dallia pectoralis TaxID=75939 RepID=A0ACC2G657_DALPE|nr:hypothetical protein DPEC_G00211170 [Dallia pectoralis]
MLSRFSVCSLNVKRAANRQLWRSASFRERKTLTGVLVREGLDRPGHFCLVKGFVVTVSLLFPVVSSTLPVWPGLHWSVLLSPWGDGPLMSAWPLGISHILSHCRSAPVHRCVISQKPLLP